MARTFLRHPWFTALHLLVFALCCMGAWHVIIKAGLPAGVADTGSTVYIKTIDSRASGLLNPGDSLRAIDGQRISITDEVEFVMDARHIGDAVTLTLVRDGLTLSQTVHAVAYYGPAYLCIMILVAGIFFAVGVFVFLRRPDDVAARLYHLGSIATALMLSCTTGVYTTDPPVLGYISRLIFYAMYALVPALFLHFILLFPRRSALARPLLLRMVYVAAIVLAGGSALTMLAAIMESSVEMFRSQYVWFTVTRVFLVASVAFGLWLIRYSYVSTIDESERRRLRWVMWGLFVGFAPFTFLWVVPQAIMHRGLVPEEVMLLASGVIPVSFGISIVRYRILNIDLLFRRSMVYGTVMVVLGGTYLLLIGLAATLLTSLTAGGSLFVSVLSAIGVALIFQPMRSFVQDLVDRRFFRIQYNYRHAQRRYLAALQRCAAESDIAAALVQGAQDVMAPEFTLVAGPGDGNGGPSVLASSGHVPESAQAVIAFCLTAHRQALPLAVEDAVETGVRFLASQDARFIRSGIHLVVPIQMSGGSTLGWLSLGPKRSGFRYSSEDVDLLGTFAGQSAREIERIRLQEELITQRAHAEHLAQVNALKSDFMSYVSHELKTPLTSIKMFAQLLGERARGFSPREREYLRIIEGESDRLNRMVSTILESTRIERGMKTYTLKPVDLQTITRRIIDTMSYQMEKEGFRVTLRAASKRTRGGLRIAGDEDAVEEAIMNLLANAMKYSGRKKVIDIRTGCGKGRAFVTVRDHGVGISAEALPHIFEKFYRDPGMNAGVQGVGLGLSVVRHVMEAHHGSIDVQSRPGRGSSFTLSFPVLTDSEHIPAAP